MERYMKALNGFVRNKARPEGGMAKGYVLEETLGFCTEYMVEFQSTRRRVWDDKEDDRVADEVPEGSGSIIYKKWLTLYVFKLMNSIEYFSYIDHYLCASNKSAFHRI